MKNTIYILIIIFFIFVLMGCNSKKKFDVEYNKNKMHNATNKIKKNISSIKKSNQTIDQESKEISEVTNIAENDLSKENLKYIKDIKNHNKTIFSQINDIDDNLINIDNYIPTLEETDNIISKMTEDIKKYEKEKEEAERKIKSGNLKMFQTIIWFSVVGFGVSVALFFLSSPKIGTAGIIATISTIVLSIGLSQYYLYIAIAGLVITIGIVGYLIFEVLIQNKAIQEIIETTEIAKERMPKKDKERVFGNKEKSGITEKIQNKNTKKIVLAKKKKLGKLWNIKKEEDKKEKEK
ncbi:MAG: hypothetical protein ACOCP8_04200 [archaeon]